MVVAPSPEARRTPRRVAPRRVLFRHEPNMPKHFFDDDLVMSHVLAVLSATFPKGEDFFVDSVRAVRDDILDDDLRSQVSGFIGQEATHGREHDRLNGVLSDLGYPTRLVDGATGAFLTLYRRIAPTAVQLATTAALEHYTAVLAEQLLGDNAFGTVDVPAQLGDMFRWHALEECEHKAVAFDAYRERYGNEAVRIATMQVASALIFAFAVPLLVVSIASDRTAWNPWRIGQSVLHLRRSPFARREILTNLLRYNLPGFHPDDRATDALVARWREELFGAKGRLNPYLDQHASA